MLVADNSDANLQTATTALEDDGHRGTAQHVDVSSRASVEALVKTATGLGNVLQVVNTAGLSPVQASPEAILRVDLFGTSLFLEQFGAVVGRGGAGLVVSSMAGYMLPALPPEHVRALAETAVDDLLALPMLSAEAVPGSGAAFAMSKLATTYRSRRRAWPGARAARGSTRSARASSSPR